MPINPNSISGLHSRFKASDPASISVANGQNVTTWNDISGNNRHLTAQQPSPYTANGPNGKGYVTGVFGADNFFPADTNIDRTFIAVWKMNGDGVDVIWDNSTDMWIHDGVAYPPAAQNHGYGFVAGTTNSKPSGWHTACQTSNLSAGSYGTGQAMIDFSPNTSINGGRYITVGHGIQFSRGGSLSVAEMMFYNRKLTWAELHQIGEYIKSEYDLYVPQVDSNHAVVAIGNSVTQVGYCAKLDQLLVDLKCPIYNLGISAGVVETINNQGPEIMELVTDLRSRNINVVAILHHGHNNGYGQTIIDHIKSPIFANIRATGTKLLALTSSARYDLGQGVEDGRILLNNWLRSPAALDYIDDVYDLGGTPEFGIFGDNGQTTGSRVTFSSLWADSVHPTVAGGIKQAQLMEAKVRDVFAAMEGPKLRSSVSVAYTNKPIRMAITAEGADWKKKTKFSVDGGVNAFVSEVDVLWNGLAIMTLNPGRATGTLTISNTSDGSTVKVNVVNPSFAGGTLLTNRNNTTVSLGGRVITRRGDESKIQ